MQDEQNCPICYELINNETSVIFQKCNHVFCRTCAINITFQYKVVCPKDRNKIKSVYDSFLIASNNLSNNSRTIAQYQDDIIKYDQRSIEDIIRQYWASSLRIFFELLIDKEKILNEINNTLSKWIENKTEISEIEPDIFDAILSQFDDHTEENFPISEMFEILCTYVDKSEEKNSNPFFVQVNKWKIMDKHLENIITSSDYDLKYLTNPHSLQHLLFDKMSIQSQNELIDVKKSQRLLRSMIISFGSNDRNLFKDKQPNILESDTNKCLICLELIKRENYSQFSHCHHKLCCRCVEEFLIIDGDCPFHCSPSLNIERNIDYSSNDNINNEMTMIFVDEKVQTMMDYVMDKLSIITTDLCDEIIKFNMMNIDKILLSSSSSHFETLITKLNSFPREISFSKAVKSTLTLYSDHLKTSFSHFTNEKYLSQHYIVHDEIRNDSLHLFIKTVTQSDRSSQLMKDVHNNFKRLLFEKRNFQRILDALYNLEDNLWDHCFDNDVDNRNENRYWVFKFLKEFCNRVKTIQFRSIDKTKCNSNLFESYDLLRTKLQNYCNEDNLQEIIEKIKCENDELINNNIIGEHNEEHDEVNDELTEQRGDYIDEDDDELSEEDSDYHDELSEEDSDYIDEDDYELIEQDVGDYNESDDEFIDFEDEYESDEEDHYESD